LALAGRAGFRCFTAVQAFKDYVEKNILANDDSQNALVAVAQGIQG
jgi:hypothetical protein